MAQAIATSQDMIARDMPSAAVPRLPPSQDLQRPNGISELDLLRNITSGVASFGKAVRLSGLSHAQKSRVLAHLAEASSRMMEATNAYLFELSQIAPEPEPKPAVRPRRPLRGPRRA